MAPFKIPRWQHAVTRWLGLLAITLGLAGPLNAQPVTGQGPACPPTAQALTPEQMQASMRQARDRGMLWRLEKDGQVGWLYGTLHVGKAAWAFPGPRVMAALLQAQTVALELDLGDPAVGQALQDGLAGWRQRQAEHPLPADLLSRLAALARVECVAGAGFDQLPAWMQGATLVLVSGRRDGLDPAFGQEFVLSRVAKAARKPVVSLESAGAQLAAMAPQDPAELRANLGQMVEQLEAGQTRHLLSRVADVWARGDMAALERYEDWCECVATPAEQAQMRRINDDRNAGLAQAIDALLVRGQRVFAAVGAMHMTGPQALPKLMAERGWTVLRVRFDPM